MATLKEMFISYKNVTPQDIFLEQEEEQPIEDPMFPLYERLREYKESIPDTKEEINDPGVAPSINDPGVTTKSEKKHKMNVPSDFKLNLYNYQKNTGDNMDKNKEEFLIKAAFLESGFKLKSLAKGSTACGYFGMIRAGRKDLGSDSEYLNNPNLQFKAASRLYDLNRRMLKPYYLKGKEMGLTDFQMMYGMWFRPKGLIDYIKSGGKDDGFKDSLGSSMKSILARAKKYS